MRAKPIVFISYTWRPDDPSNPNDDPEARGLDLANRLREAGFDCRIDKYFMFGKHGFKKPFGRAGDKVNDPWVIWQEDQIQEANSVLLVCSGQYAATVCESPLGGELTWEQWHSMSDELKYQLQNFQMDENQGKKAKVPYVWWDWHFMIKDLESGRVERNKFIPVGFRPHSAISHDIPSFIKGETYFNLDSNEGFEGLLRNIKTQFRNLHPRKGIFVSYSHRDDKWLDVLLQHLAFLQQQGVNIWTDRRIEPGDRWRDEIADALATAQVAVLLVTPAFLESSFIQDHELPTLLRAAKSEGLVVFWIPVKPSSYEQYEIGQFQAAHHPAKPLSKLNSAKRDEALVEIANKLAQKVGLARR